MSPGSQTGTGIAKKNYLKRRSEGVGHLQPASPPQLSLEWSFSQLHPAGGGQGSFLQPAMLLLLWEVQGKESKLISKRENEWVLIPPKKHNSFRTGQTLKPSPWLEDFPLPGRISWCQEGLEVPCDLGDHDHGAHDHDHGRQGGMVGPRAGINSGGSQCQQIYCISADGCYHSPGWSSGACWLFTGFVKICKKKEIWFEGSTMSRVRKAWQDWPRGWDESEI